MPSIHVSSAREPRAGNALEDLADTVYWQGVLDADSLDISGYPTMLVLSPQGREVLRLRTGLQIEAFNNGLDDALAQMAPIG